MTGTFVATMQRNSFIATKIHGWARSMQSEFCYKCHWPKSDLWTVLQLPLTKINAQTGLKNGPNIIEPIRLNNLWTRKITAEESSVEIRAANLKRSSSCALRTHCSVMTEVKIDKSLILLYCHLFLSVTAAYHFWLRISFFYLEFIRLKYLSFCNRFRP